MTRRAYWSGAGVVVGVAILSGCSASVSGPSFQKIQIPEGKGVIYVYRPAASYKTAGLRPQVTCGQDGVDLGSGGYYPFIVDPGTTTCRVTAIDLIKTTSEVDVPCTAGQENYVKDEDHLAIVWGVRPHLDLMDRATGEKEASDCKLQP